MFVSHNHSFANQLATHVWDVGGGAVEIQPGNLEDHLDRVRRRKAAARRNGAATEERARSRRPEMATENGSRPRRATRGTRARSLCARSCRQIEARIAVLEAEDKTAQAALADPDLYQDYARAKPHMDVHQRATRELERLYARWEELQQSLGTA